MLQDHWLEPYAMQYLQPVPPEIAVDNEGLFSLHHHGLLRVSIPPDKGFFVSQDLHTPYMCPTTL